MAKVVNASTFEVPGRGKICSIILDEWPEALKNGDRLLIGGRVFDYGIVYIRWIDEVDSRPHLSIQLEDEATEAEWFVGKDVVRA